MADVDARTDEGEGRGSHEELGVLRRVQADGVLDKQQRRSTEIRQRVIDLSERGEVVVRSGHHLGLIMHDESGQPARRRTGDRGDEGPAGWLQQVEVPRQMHDDGCSRGTESSESSGLVRRGGVDLGPEAGRGEAHHRQLKERVVTVEAFLEQPEQRQRRRWRRSQGRHLTDPAADGTGPR